MGFDARVGVRGTAGSTVLEALMRIGPCIEVSDWSKDCQMMDLRDRTRARCDMRD